MKKLLALLTFVAALTGAGLAHDGAHGMKGTVTAIDETTITIVTPTKETHTIHFDGKTNFEKSGSPASVKDLKVGERVIIEAHDASGTMHASKVRFGKPPKKSQTQQPGTGQGHSDHVSKDKR